MLPLGVTLLVAMAVAWAIALYLLTDAIDRRLDAQLENATSILAEGNFPFSPDLIGRLDRIIEARIILLDDTGNIGLSTGGETVNRGVASMADALIQLRGDETATSTLSAEGEQWRVVARRLLPAPRQAVTSCKR